MSMSEPSKPQGLYVVTERLVDSHASWFLKIEAHEGDDPDGSDLLWVSVSEDEMTEGEVVMLGPLSEGRWYVSHDHANKYGGWPTVWSVAGTLDEVLIATAAYLRAEMPSVQARGATKY